MQRGVQGYLSSLQRRVGAHIGWTNLHPRYHVELYTFYCNVGTLGQTPCGPDGEDGQPVGECDIIAECFDNEVPCPAGDSDCLFETSICCVEGTTAPAGC